MKHKWKDNKCIVCGCNREKQFGVFWYNRSGIFFRLNELPECINWEVENNKTID